MTKQIKDPIYGYIRLPKELFTKIIDTEIFQRLRNIRQTSYSPLYPMAFHNRFIHSIGVYHLGTLVTNRLNELDDIKNLNNNDKISETFCLACLLHDVGHAPFSHTGEIFYKDIIDKNRQPIIHSMLTDLINNDDFSKDARAYIEAGRDAAPHEIMSAIVGLKHFKGIIGEDYIEFFARCITGYRYNNTTAKNQILNCFINLLNSSLIDVDRLDYIIRDAFSTGFQNVSIDYVRLINGIDIIEVEKEKNIVYLKSALSVIENVLYAHDAEKKWIQTHPVIVYENFLIEAAIKNVINMVEKNGSSLFSYKSLSPEGNDLGDNIKIRLLSDEDIVFFSKNNLKNQLVNEIFSRDKRRRPIWKSEMEYNALFCEKITGKKLNEFEAAIDRIYRYIMKTFDNPVIDQSLINKCNEKISELDELEKKHDIAEKDATTLKSGLHEVIKWAECLKQFSRENDISFDYVVIKANKFKSNFMKSDMDNIRVFFPNTNQEHKLKDVASILTSEERRKQFFYIFAEKEASKKINPEDFSNHLIKLVLS